MAEKCKLVGKKVHVGNENCGIAAHCETLDLFVDRVAEAKEGVGDEDGKEGFEGGGGEYVVLAILLVDAVKLIGGGWEPDRVEFWFMPYFETGLGRGVGGIEGGGKFKKDVDENGNAGDEVGVWDVSIETLDVRCLTCELGGLGCRGSEEIALVRLKWWMMSMARKELSMWTARPRGAEGEMTHRTAEKVA